MQYYKRVINEEEVLFAEDTTFNEEISPEEFDLYLQEAAELDSQQTVYEYSELQGA